MGMASRHDRGAPREMLIAWLNDAHTTEQALVPILENHARDAREHPDIQARDEPVPRRAGEELSVGLRGGGPGDGGETGP